MPRNLGQFAASYLTVLIILFTGTMIWPLSRITNGCLLAWLCLFFVVSWVVIACSLFVLAGCMVAAIYRRMGKNDKQGELGSDMVMYDRWLDGL